VLDPSAFLLEGGSVGVLLLHGFTGAPPEMRLLGDFLHERGLTVSAPLLPGHGTSLVEMNRCRWEDWTGAVEAALAELRRRCGQVFVGGLSMGSLLALHLAARHDDLCGVMAYAPALRLRSRLIHLTPFLRRILASRPKPRRSDLMDPEAEARLWAYDRHPVAAAAELLRGQRLVRAALPRVRCPALVVHSTRDASVHPQSAEEVLLDIGSQDKRILILNNSGHVLTLDAEWREVAQESWEFIRRHSG